jgi:hypothetical protein
MKTQLIPLESHDDLISVRDRMSWAKTPRILLVWPKSVRIALRPLDLKVLQRHATSLGAQLGLVTRHRSIRREAQALGIPVFGSTGEAQRVPWPERSLREKRERRISHSTLLYLREQVRAREDAWRSHPFTRISAFLLGVLAVLALVSLFVPRAQVILTPETRTQTVTLPVQADLEINSVFITGNIPSRQVSVVIEGSQGALATGSVPVPQTKAEGVVTFRNLTEQEVIIPAGTVLTSTGLPGVRFLTMEPGELPPELEATVDVSVQAESAGVSGNVETGTILAIEGDLGLLVTVTNEQATIGGRDRITQAATEKDLARLRESLLDDLEKKALDEIYKLLEADDQIFDHTVEIKQILVESYDPPSGQASRKVTLTMQVEFTASYASGEDLAELADIVLNASLPDGFDVASDQLTFETVNAPQPHAPGITRWVVRVSRQLEKQVDAGQIVPLVRGRSMEAAIAQLENMALASKPVIQLTPEWWPWLPLIPFNISVEMR